MRTELKPIDWNLTALSDDELLSRLSDLLTRSRCAEVELVAHIAEVDARRLYAREAAPSMFTYCTEVLHLSEFEAYLRITVARISRRYPVVLAHLADGRLHLTAVARLAPHLTPENADALLRRAQHRSKRQLKELIAELAPRVDAPTIVRKLPERKGGGSLVTPHLRLSPEPMLTAFTTEVPAGPVIAQGDVGKTQLGPDRVESSRLNVADDASAACRSAEMGAKPVPLPPAPAAGEVQPLSPGRYKVQFTGGPELPDTLERLQALLRSAVPDGDIGTIVLIALREKLERLEARRFAKTGRPRKAVLDPPTRTTSGATTGIATVTIAPGSRYIPAPVRRAVEARDGGRCVYRDASGRRCTRRHDLEFHHRRPFGYGGEHSLANLALACRTHNSFLAELDYGSSKHGLQTTGARSCAAERDLRQPQEPGAAAGAWGSRRSLGQPQEPGAAGGAGGSRRNLRQSQEPEAVAGA